MDESPTPEPLTYAPSSSIPQPLRIQFDLIPNDHAALNWIEVVQKERDMVEAEIRKLLLTLVAHREPLVLAWRLQTCGFHD